MALDLPPRFYLPPKPAIIRSWDKRPAQELLKPAPLRHASFLPGMFPAHFLASGIPAASIAFGDVGVSSSNPSNSYNYGTKNLGTDDATRIMLLLILSDNASVTSDTTGPTSVSVGGNAASKVVNLPASSSVERWSAWTVTLSGTSANVTIGRSIGSGFAYCHFGMWATYNLLSGTPSSSNQGSFADPATATIATQTDGILAAIVGASSAAGNFNWTNATENFDQTAGVSSSQRFSGASLATPSASASYTVTADGSSGGIVLAVALR